MVSIIKKREIKAYLLFFLLAAAFFLINAGATNSGSSENANLTIYDEIDLNGDLVKISNQQFAFYANFTNSSNSVINQTQGNGNCSAEFNFSGSYTSPVKMTFNASYVWVYNRTFNYKGTHQFRVNCTSAYGNVTLNDSFAISNSAPKINLTEGGSFIDIDGNPSTNDRLQCTEDQLCTYNFSANVTEIDANDVLTYNFSTNANTTLTNYTLNTSSGILTISINTSNQTGLRQIELNVKDTESPLQSGILRVNITDVNDAPNITNLNNMSFNISQLFNYTVIVTDEENNTPFNLTINFTSCTVAQWSNRDCNTASGRELFNSSQFTFNTTTGILNISFTPSRNDAGNYTINFTVSDLNNNINPKNATTTKSVNFEVLNVNLYPYFRYACDNERNATENLEARCYFNASDLDEINNLTITANETWFIFNETGTNRANKSVNLTFSYNASFYANFTANDSMVGNWSLNISLRDTGDPTRTNSTTFYFFIANVNDSAGLHAIPNVTVYSTNNQTLFINASDNDLLIPDKRVYNESLTFQSNLSWVTITANSTISGTNITSARIIIAPNSTLLGDHNVNISVRDANNFSSASRVILITVINNSAPAWNTTQTNYSLTEGTAFFLNLSGNASDPNGDQVNFSFINYSAFASFQINVTSGVINFTPIDDDVGYHLISINASDGRVGALLDFNFTISNINDNPLIIRPFTSLSVSGNNATADSSGNINVTEENRVLIQFFADDNDFRIPTDQKGFYNEGLNLSLAIQGHNTALFNFTADSGFPTALNLSTDNRSRFSTTFTPNKSDVGDYNITINITDLSNASTSFRFNLTVLSIQHDPVLGAISNQNSSILEEFYLDAQANDSEDGNETFLNLTFSITNLTANGNFLSINRTTGIINATMNQTFAGLWTFNVSVNDTSGRYAYRIFNLSVYDYPKILAPNSSYVFNLKENTSIQLNFSVNHSVLDALNYTLIVLNYTRNSSYGNGNGSNFLWNFTANFTDETACRISANLSLNVSNAKLSNFTTWNVTINHTNYPLAFSGFIGGGNEVLSGTNSVTVTLSDYYSDLDASDCNNQSIGFVYVLRNTSGGTISVSITNWSNATTPQITFSASTSGVANYTVYGYEINSSNTSQILRNVTSNNFTIDITVSTSPSPSPSSGGGGGGGGGSTEKPVSLKLILPGQISAERKGIVVVPIGLENNGQDILNGIGLTSSVYKDGILLEDIVSSFDRNRIARLASGQKDSVNLTLEINTDVQGTYEITVNASVENPVYNDWGKIILRIQPGTVGDKLIFIEELVAQNPECAEIKDLVKEARELYDLGVLNGAEDKINEAVNACRQAIAQKPAQRLQGILRQTKVFSYVGIASVIAFILGFAYYWYKRLLLRRKLMGEDVQS